MCVEGVGAPTIQESKQGRNFSLIILWLENLKMPTLPQFGLIERGGG